MQTSKDYFYKKIPLLIFDLELNFHEELSTPVEP